MPLDTTCLYSTVKNNSGVRKKFGFLPPHGRELAAAEEFSVFGDIREAIRRHERTGDRRNIQAFEAAMARGDLLILKTPSPVLESPGGNVFLLDVSDAGALSTMDPCWFSST